MNEIYPAYWGYAHDYLRARDPILASLMLEPGDSEALQSKGSAWLTMARAIVSQQISVRAADAIWQRLAANLGCEQAEAAAGASLEQLRACGLSQRKAEYLQTVANWCLQQDPQRLYCADWLQLRAEMLRLRGVGNWTCEMFAMFFRLEPDELPLGDIGVHRALSKFYQLDVKKPQHKSKLDKLSQLWSPYRTVATWYLWRAIDAEPVNY